MIVCLGLFKPVELTLLHFFYMDTIGVHIHTTYFYKQKLKNKNINVSFI